MTIIIYPSVEFSQNFANWLTQNADSLFAKYLRIDKISVLFIVTYTDMLRLKKASSPCVRCQTLHM